MSWTNSIDGEGGGTAENVCTERVRAIEVSETALTRAKDLFAAAASAELSSVVKGGHSPLWLHTGTLERSSASEGKENWEGRGRASAKRLPGTPGRRRP